MQHRCMSCMRPIAGTTCPYCGFNAQDYSEESFELPMGTIINGRYLIGKRLGQGGFGITYVGLDLALDVKVAIKEYFPSGQVTRHPSTGTMLLWSDGEHARNMKTSGMEAFLKEARKMAKVQNVATVVRVLNTFQENETAYIVMEFVEGITMKTLLEEHGPISWEQAELLFYPVIETMEEVHNAGIIHRDISPDNLILQPDGTIRILDLGAAKDINSNAGRSSMLVTKEGYSPIEQYTQSGGTGTWTDVYSLAATIFTAITGQTPSPAVERYDHDSMQWNCEELGGVPANVIAALRSAMEVLPDDRTQTMKEFLGNLKKKGFRYRKVKHKKKKRNSFRVALTVILAVLLCGAGAFYALWYLPNQQGKSSVPATEMAHTDTEEQTDESVAITEKPEPIITGPVQLARSFSGTDASKNEIVSISFKNAFPNQDVSSWDVSADNSRSILAWLEPSDKGYALNIGSTGTIVLPKDSSRLFADYSEMRSLELGENVTVERGTTVQGMFSGCASLEYVNLNGISAVLDPDLSELFMNCSSLREIVWEDMNTFDAENMDRMFFGCSSLENIDRINLMTSNTVSMEQMFAGVHSENIDIWKLNVAKVNNHTGFMDDNHIALGRPWGNLFLRDKMLISDSNSINVFGSGYKRSDITGVYFKDELPEQLPNGAWDVSAAGDRSIMAWVEKRYGSYYYLTIAANGGVLAPEDCSEMFSGYSAMEHFDCTALDTSCTVNMRGMFRQCSKIVKLDLSPLNTSHVENMSEMFYFCDGLSTLVIENFDTSSVRDMSGMFSECRSSNLTKLNIEGFDTSKVEDMSSMFYNCLHVRYIDVSHFDTANVRNMKRMFMSCKTVIHLNPDNFNTSKVEDMSGMFMDCNTVGELNVSNFDTSSVTNMSNMFNNATNLSKLDVSGFNTSQVVDMTGMFMGCKNLTRLDVTNFDTGKVTNMSRMFYHCTNLYNIDVSGFNVQNVTAWENFMDSGHSVGDGKFWNTMFEA